MQIRIVGIQNQKYKLDNGYEFEGVKVHCIDESTFSQDLAGQLVTTVKIPAKSPLAAVPLIVGASYDAFFDQKGRLDTLREISHK